MKACVQNAVVDAEQRPKKPKGKKAKKQANSKKVQTPLSFLVFESANLG